MNNPNKQRWNLISIYFVGILFLIFVVFVIFAPFCEAEELTILSPSISVRDSKLSSKLPYDYQFAIIVWDIGNQRLYLELERENGKFYRNREFRIQAYGAYLSDIQYTMRNIWVMEFGYVYKYENVPFQVGASIMFDNGGRPNKMAVVEYKGKYLFARWIKGKSKWIIDTNFRFGAPLGKEVFRLGRFSFQPAYELLLKWYQNNKRKYRQFKISFVILFKY